MAETRTERNWTRRKCNDIHALFCVSDWRRLALAGASFAPLTTVQRLLPRRARSLHSGQVTAGIEGKVELHEEMENNIGDCLVLLVGGGDVSAIIAALPERRLIRRNSSDISGALGGLSDSSLFNCD
jgi:hypothetical protein